MGGKGGETGRKRGEVRGGERREGEGPDAKHFGLEQPLLLGPMSCWLDLSPSRDCGQRQTVNHIVDTCPLTKFEGGQNLLHEADDDAVIWLEYNIQRLQPSRNSKYC